MSKYASISLDGSVFVVGGESFKPEYQLVSIIAKYSQGIHEPKISFAVNIVIIFYSSSWISESSSGWEKVGNLHQARASHGIGFYSNQLLVVGIREELIMISIIDEMAMTVIFNC